MKRVLIVDDDAVSRLVLRHMLERQEFDVAEADSVDAALVVLAEPGPEFDLIVCDYLMPEKNGLDLLGQLGETTLPFVLLTGELNRDDLNDERVAAVSAYVTKPVATDELERVVSNLIPAAAEI